jgi:hypothetical protein
MSIVCEDGFSSLHPVVQVAIVVMFGIVTIAFLFGMFGGFGRE